MVDSTVQTYSWQLIHYSKIASLKTNRPAVKFGLVDLKLWDNERNIKHKFPHKITKGYLCVSFIEKPVKYNSTTLLLYFWLKN